MPKFTEVRKPDSAEGFVKIIIIFLVICALIIGYLIYKRRIIFPKLTFKNTVNTVVTPEVKKSNVQPFLKPKEQIKYAPRENLNETILAKKALLALIEKSWNPKKKDIPITYKDLNDMDLLQMIEAEKTEENAVKIPDEFKPLLTTFEVANDINMEIFTDYTLFINYLELKGINGNYLNELKTNTLPAEGDRLIYHYENSDNTGISFTEPVVVEIKISNTVEKHTDYSKLRINIYADDVYKNMQVIMKTKLFDNGIADDKKDENYYKNIRNVAIKFIVFREMTHALQRAMITVNSPEIEKTAEDAWVYSTRNLINVNKSYYWKWGTQYYTESNDNKALTQESQAYGVAFEILTNKMTDEQKSIFWDYEFGRYDEMQKSLDDMKILFEEKLPEYSPDRFTDILTFVVKDYPDPEGSKYLQAIVKKLGFFPEYIGKLHPMKAEDSKWFWNALKN